MLGNQRSYIEISTIDRGGDEDEERRGKRGRDGAGGIGGSRRTGGEEGEKRERVPREIGPRTLSPGTRDQHT